MTGSVLPEDAIRAEAANVAVASTDLVGALRGLSPHLDPSERETVVRSAIMVAIADGSVGEEEHALVAEIANAVDVSESHLRGILAQIAEARGEMA